MNVRHALAEQYRAGLAMLADCVEKCPDDLWTSGEYPRYFWRIAFHTAFFTHVYLVQDEASYEPWPGRPEGLHDEMWQDPSLIEPYELPEGAEPFTKQQTLDYIAYLSELVGPTVDSLDLDAEETGYRWYPNMSKLSHEIMNVGHIQYHVGQLYELLMARGIEPKWIAKA